MKCGTRTCQTDAAYSVFWPGSPLKLCGICADSARRIADVMGFNLSVDPIEWCACHAIDAGRVGFCRDHRRAFIPADCEALTRALIVALALDAGITLATTADGSRVGAPS